MPVDATTSSTLAKIYGALFHHDDSTGLETPTFPATVAALADLGVNRYRIDFSTGTVTSYIGTETDVYDFGSSGSATIKSVDPAPGTVKWDLSKLQKTIKVAQDKIKEGRSTYEEFEKGVVGAGVVDYTTFIDGKKIVYAGVLGDLHVEPFPGARAANARALREAVGMVDI